MDEKERKEEAKVGFPGQTLFKSHCQKPALKIKFGDRSPIFSHDGQAAGTLSKALFTPAANTNSC